MVHLVEINDTVGIACGIEHQTARVCATRVPLLAILVGHGGIDAPVAAIARHCEGTLRSRCVYRVAATGCPVVHAVNISAAMGAEGILHHTIYDFLFKCKDIGEVCAAHGRLRCAVSNALVCVGSDA